MPSYVRPGIRKCAKNRALSSDGIAEIAVLHAGVTGHGNDPTAASGKNQYHG